MVPVFIAIVIVPVVDLPVVVGHAQIEIDIREGVKVAQVGAAVLGAGQVEEMAAPETVVSVAGDTCAMPVFFFVSEVYGARFEGCDETGPDCDSDSGMRMVSEERYDGEGR